MRESSSSIKMQHMCQTHVLWFEIQQKETTSRSKKVGSDKVVQKSEYYVGGVLFGSATVFIVQSSVQNKFCFLVFDTDSNLVISPMNVYRCNAPPLLWCHLVVESTNLPSPGCFPGKRLTSVQF